MVCSGAGFVSFIGIDQDVQLANTEKRAVDNSTWVKREGAIYGSLISSFQHAFSSFVHSLPVAIVFRCITSGRTEPAGLSLRARGHRTAQELGRWISLSSFQSALSCLQPCQGGRAEVGILHWVSIRREIHFHNLQARLSLFLCSPY